MAAALVLSAGGMFGAYQAGAWRALEGRFRPDLVVGASVGALNGWAIAGGCAPEELVDRWLDPGTGRILRLGIGFPAVFRTAGLEALAQELVARYRPQVPFAAVLVEVPSLRLRIVRDSEITWRHLVAACSIALVMPPVRLHGRLYADGGLLGALPLWAAAELGATRTVAVNALPEMPSRLLRGAMRVLRRLQPPARAGAAIEVVTIAPGRPLGGLADMVRWRPAKICRWIAEGEADGRLAVSVVSTK